MSKISRTTQKFMDHLGCDCRYIGSSHDMRAVTKEYHAALERGKAEGFTPVIIAVDGILWEAVSAAISDEGEITPELACGYRERILSEKPLDAKSIFVRREEEYQYLFDCFFEEDVCVPVDGEKSESVFGDGTTSEIIIASIPTAEPWRVFAWIPFGGFNSCPSTEELIAVSQYWHDLYGAYPAFISYDRLEYHVERPADADTAMGLCEEHMTICPTIAELISPSAYGGSIKDSDMWSFWWD